MVHLSTNLEVFFSTVFYIPGIFSGVFFKLMDKFSSLTSLSPGWPLLEV